LAKHLDYTQNALQWSQMGWYSDGTPDNQDANGQQQSAENGAYHPSLSVVTSSDTNPKKRLYA
jgi:hypothetical protein